MPRFTPHTDTAPGPFKPPAMPAPGAATAQAAASQPMTLDALLLRQKQLAGEQGQAAGLNNGTIFGGLGSMAQSFFQGVNERGVQNDINQGQQEIAANFPNAFDPATGQINQQALQAIGARSPETMQEVYRMAMQARQHAEEMDLQRQKAANEAGGGAPKLSDIGALRDDYVKAANVYDSSAPAWEDMKRSAPLALDPTNPSAGAATYSLIVGYAKLLDPTSVVREGEVSAASNLGGLLDTINGWLLKAKNGTMDPNTLKAIMQQADSRMRGYYDQVKTKRDWLTGVATRNRMNPEDVVAPLGEYQGWQDAAPPPDQPPPPDTPGKTVVSMKRNPDGTVTFTYSDGSTATKDKNGNTVGGG